MLSKLFLIELLLFFFSNVELKLINETEKSDKDLLEIDSDMECKMQPNGFDCSGKGRFTSIFYYDILLEDCKTKYIGQCPHQLNTFKSHRECSEACRDTSRKEIKSEKGKIPTKVYCRLQPDFGRCHSYHPMWYFDLSSRTCKGFSYSGCGGNINRFPTHQDCVAACSSLLSY